MNDIKDINYNKLNNLVNMQLDFLNEIKALIDLDVKDNSEKNLNNKAYAFIETQSKILLHIKFLIDKHKNDINENITNEKTTDENVDNINLFEVKEK